MIVLKIKKDDLDSALNAADGMLRAGKIIVYPTDTVYGIGCDATNEEAVDRLRKIKGIGRDKELSVMVGDYGAIDYYCETGIWEDMAVRKYLPGPYTFILKKQRGIHASYTEKLGVRIPENEFCQNLARKFGGPIITTSANPTRQPAPTKFGDIEKKVLEQVDLAIDGGETKYRGHSIVFDLVDHKLIRESDQIDLLNFPER